MMVPQPRQNPSTDNLHSHFNFCFVLRAILSRRQNCSSIVAGEIGVGAVDHRFVEARSSDARLEIVAHRLPGRTAKLFDMTNDPRQMTNLTKRPEHADVVRELTRRLAEHLRATARQPELIPRTEDAHELLDFLVQPRDVGKK